MKVILMEDVANLGSIGDTVDVKDGYARNFLIPRKLAIAATARNLKAQAHKLAAIDRKKEKAAEEARSLADRLAATSLTFTRKAGETGRLFGSVTNMDITDALADQGITVDRKDVILDDHIKELGEFDVSVKLHQDVPASVKITVIKEEESGTEE